MKYTIVGTPQVQAEYCDKYETTMVIDLKREDGVEGDVWIVAGVQDYWQGLSDAARTQEGYQGVRTFGDHPDMWCPHTFDCEDAEDVLLSVVDVALSIHNERLAGGN
jgi:hypothetical protein